MKLRTHLLFLALATLLPVLLFAVYVATQLVERERDTFRRGAADRTRAILTAVDLQINGTVSTLESVAFTRTLDVGDLTSFQTVARRVLASRDDWRTCNCCRSTARRWSTRRPISAGRGPRPTAPRSCRRWSSAPRRRSAISWRVPAANSSCPSRSRSCARAVCVTSSRRRCRRARSAKCSSRSACPSTGSAPSSTARIASSRAPATASATSARWPRPTCARRSTWPTKAGTRARRSTASGCTARTTAPASAAGRWRWACPPRNSTRARSAAPCS